MIVTVTPNPAIDVTYTIDAVELGASHRVHDVAACAGGKGVNVARVLRSRGADVVAVAPVGGLGGERFAADLDAAGIQTRLVPVSAPTRSTLAIVTRDATTNLNESGNPLTSDEWKALADAAEAALAERHARVLVLSGSIPPSTPTSAIERIVDVGRRRAVPTVVDTSGEHLLAAADAGATVLKPNREELLAAVGGDDPIRAARALARRSGGLVIASLDAEGLAAVRSQGAVWRARLDAELFGNTTGAGDAVVASIALHLAEAARAGGASAPGAASVLDDRLHDLLERACAWGAAAVLAPQAGRIVDPDQFAGRVRVTLDQ